jgi:hypothetical protein
VGWPVSGNVYRPMARSAGAVRPGRRPLSGRPIGSTGQMAQRMGRSGCGRAATTERSGVWDGNWWSCAVGTECNVRLVEAQRHVSAVPGSRLSFRAVPV